MLRAGPAFFFYFFFYFFFFFFFFFFFDRSIISVIDVCVGGVAEPTPVCHGEKKYWTVDFYVVLDPYVPWVPDRKRGSFILLASD